MIHNQDLFDLFHHKLRHMWFVEKKIHAALPKMANAANSDALRAALKKHERETERQMVRIGTIFGAINRPTKEGASVALPALLDECTEAVVNFRESSALDVALIAAAQVVEHYEITCYRALKAWAEHLQIQGAVDLIDESLGEEEKAAEALTELADELVSSRARKDNDGPRRRSSPAA
jgi:ferritin-like metal-binding protein YciE